MATCLLYYLTEYSHPNESKVIGTSYNKFSAIRKNSKQSKLSWSLSLVTWSLVRKLVHNIHSLILVHSFICILTVATLLEVEVCLTSFWREQKFLFTWTRILQYLMTLHLIQFRASILLLIRMGLIYRFSVFPLVNNTPKIWSLIYWLNGKCAKQF